MAEPTVLPCSECGLPFAKIEHGCLVIESRHHGEKHVNYIALDLLARTAGYMSVEQFQKIIDKQAEQMMHSDALDGIPKDSPLLTLRKA